MIFQEVSTYSQLLKKLYPKTGSDQLANTENGWNDLTVTKMGGHDSMIGYYCG